MLNYITLTVLFYFSVASVNSFAHEEISNLNVDQNNFDFVVLSQSWPQTSCWGLNEKWNESELECSSCAFLPKSKRDWTMHGVWPSKISGNHPFLCEPRVEYDPELLNQFSLRDQMNEKWPSMVFPDNVPNNDKFWKHEWEKHGSCALGLPGMNNLTSYFSKSLELMSQINVGKILAESGIVPGRTEYQYEEIRNVFRKTLNVEVVPQCLSNNRTNEQYFDQVYICMDKSFKPINCIDNRTHCAIEKPIIYPRILTTCH